MGNASNPANSGESQLPTDNKRRCFALYSRQPKPEIEAALAQTSELLKQAGIDVADVQSVLGGTNVEGLLAFGGDGTLLHAVRLMAPLGIPVLGVNFGHVGYLCAIKENDIPSAIQLIIDRQYTIEARTMLQGDVYHEGELAWQSRAFNEFHVGGCNRTVILEIFINEHSLGRVRGDGIIVATRTGSTAYALSAGGPVLLLDALSLVASNAVYSSAIRSLVLPTDSRIRIRNLTEIARPYVIADGQKDFLISKNTELIITASDCPALLLNLGLQSDIETLHRGFQEIMIRELDPHQ